MCYCPSDAAVCDLTNLAEFGGTVCNSTKFNPSTGALNAHISLKDVSDHVPFIMNFTGVKSMTGWLAISPPVNALTKLKGIYFPDLISGTKAYLLDETNTPLLEEIDMSSIVDGGYRLDELQGRPKLRSIKLSSLTTWSTRLLVKDNPVLETLSLASVATTPSSIKIENNGMLTSLELPKLTTITNDITITGNANLSSVRLPALTRSNSNDDLIMTSNPKLTTVELTALVTENSVQGDIELKHDDASTGASILAGLTTGRLATSATSGFALICARCFPSLLYCTHRQLCRVFLLLSWFIYTKTQMQKSK